MRAQKVFRMLAVAAAMAYGGSALADVQVVPVSGPTTSVFDTTPFTDSFVDVKLFSGLAAGAYDFAFSFTGMGISLFDPQTITFNGAVVPLNTAGPLSSGLVTGTLTVTNAPLTFAMAGTASPGAFYVTALSVTPVPEPETYALFGAGLGAIGFLIRRRNRG